MTRFLWTVPAALTGLLLPLAAAAQPSGEYSGYGYHMWNGGWLGWIFGPLMMIVFVGVIVAVVMLLTRGVSGPAHHAPGPSSRPDPLDILKERFARGEIDQKEFEERRRVLGQ